MSTTYTVNEIKERLALVERADDAFLQAVLTDERKSVQALVKKQLKQIKMHEQLVAAHHERLEFERALYANKDIHYIAGIDEVGRGPLAGPVVTAAVILPRNCDTLIGVNDSKQLSHEKRELFCRKIEEVALAISIHVCEVSEIDRLNIYQATRWSMLESVRQLAIQPDYLLIDAMEIDTSIPQQSLIKGDQRSLSIAAASIVAKVYRDNLMMAYAKEYPEFGFEQHKGYGTQQHLEALALHGYTPIHRKSFTPITTMTHIYHK